MKRIRLLAPVLLCILLCACSSAAQEDGAAGLEIRFLDVGQGDCILLRTEEGDFLVDTGTEASERALCHRLGELGVTELTLGVISHADEDHFGGADGVLAAIPAREVWLPAPPGDTDAARRFDAVCKAQNTTLRYVHIGEWSRYGKLAFFVYSPISEEEGAGNDGSIVLFVRYGDVTMMLMGDAGQAVERRLLAHYGAVQMDCDLYKVGHHGSESSTSEEFLKAMSPDYAVISCGRGNPYGHPHGTVLRLLEEQGCRVLRTDRMGEIRFLCDGETLTLAMEE